MPLPPKSLRLLNGHREFRQMGKSIAGSIVAETGMAAGDRVLDAGCGSGRVAVPLIEVLGPDGTYDGFDVVPEAIAWCDRNITSRHPNFRFQLADIYSDHYHRKGRSAAEDYVFPYADASFDVVFLTSIFTHLGAAPTENYLRECERVLAPGGRLYASFFLYDDYAEEAASRGESEYAFVPAEDGSLTANPRDPGAAAAHRESTVRAILGDAGLEIETEPLRGNWNGRETNRRQDIVLAVKPA